MSMEQELVLGEELRVGDLITVYHNRRPRVLQVLRIKRGRTTVTVRFTNGSVKTLPGKREFMIVRRDRAAA